MQVWRQVNCSSELNLAMSIMYIPKHQLCIVGIGHL